ncbi:YqjD family protein [Pseudoruegeria sp. HB172150]|uniref:DUF883 family protein n=1 Tax=Pseudoruegeria sp. HB172150 TaxID=2721164 RepID=UPI001556FCD9|nr:DUF883 family protein [Pseudoruegeria sp. HB172150]
MATAASTPKSNGTSTSKDVEELQAQIATLKADITALTETMKTMGKTRAAQLREQGEAAVGQAKVKGLEAYEQAEASVRENPAMAVGIAAGVGFLVGVILGRK